MTSLLYHSVRGSEGHTEVEVPDGGRAVYAEEVQRVPGVKPHQDGPASWEQHILYYKTHGDCNNTNLGLLDYCCPH